MSAWLFTYTLNIFIAEHGWHDNLGGWRQHLSHFLMLAVEEQFYLVRTLLVLFLPCRALVPLLTTLQRYGVSAELDIVLAATLSAIAFRWWPGWRRTGSVRRSDPSWSSVP